MNILIAYYQLNQPGGVNTWVENFINGAKFLGHTVGLYHASLSGGMKVHPELHTRMGKTVRSEDRLPGGKIAYGTDVGIDDFIAIAKNYDIVVFAHPSPHDTKSYDDPNMMWLKLYSECPVPTISIFHDDGWKRTNKWVVQIADYCECILCAQHRFYEYFVGDKAGDPFPYIKDEMIVTWESFPIAWEEDLGMYDSAKLTDLRMGVCLSQWQGWKNHKHLLPQLCDYQSFELHLLGSGIQYYYQRKEDYWKCAIGRDNVVGEQHSDSPHRYAGYRPYSEIPEILEMSSFAIDASTRGRENMSMIEPMAYGALSIITEDVLIASPVQKLTEDFVIAAPLDGLGAVMEEVCGNFSLYTPERLAGIEFVRKYHTIEGVSARLIMLFEAIIDGETGLHPEGVYEWLK